MSKKILIVEDDRHIVALVRYILEREGFQVKVARDGIEGLEMAEEYWPDLVVLDLNMPRMDGIEMCRRLKAGQPDVRVIFLTVHAERTAIARGYRAGADDYVVKPFELQDLLKRIRQLLQEGVRKGDSIPSLQGPAD